jgi:hypothetical protein
MRGISKKLNASKTYKGGAHYETLTQIINHSSRVCLKFHKFLGTEGVKRAQESNGFHFKWRETLLLKTLHQPRARRPVKGEQRGPIAVIQYIRAVGPPTYPIERILVIFEIARI